MTFGHLRRQAKDGNLSVDKDSRLLLTTSLRRAMVVNDDAGNTRLAKRGHNNCARDDVAAALVLAAGAVERLPKSGRGIYLGSRRMTRPISTFHAESGLASRKRPWERSEE